MTNSNQPPFLLICIRKPHFYQNSLLPKCHNVLGAWKKAEGTCILRVFPKSFMFTAGIKRQYQADQTDARVTARVAAQWSPSGTSAIKCHARIFRENPSLNPKMNSNLTTFEKKRLRLIVAFIEVRFQMGFRFRNRYIRFVCRYLAKYIATIYIFIYFKNIVCVLRIHTIQCKNFHYACDHPLGCWCDELLLECESHLGSGSEWGAGSRNRRIGMRVKVWGSELGSLTGWLTKWRGAV